MRNNILISFILMLLCGCAAKPAFDNFQSKEKLLLQTGNYKKLVPLYKNRLAENGADAIRLKLAEAYLKSGDPESAIFISSPLLAAKKTDNMPLYLLQAYSYYELDEIDKALRSAEIAKLIEKNNPRIENLLGMIYAASENYAKARFYFNQARGHLYDDIKIKNNLAVLDMIEGKYQNAIQLLLPIYSSDNADPQVKANLLLAMAKTDAYENVQSILANEYSPKEISEMYQALKNIVPLTTNNELLPAPYSYQGGMN